MAISNTHEFENISVRKRARCAVCGRVLGHPTLEFPKLPLTEIFITPKPAKPVGFVDGAFHICSHCSHGQLGTIVDPRVVYSPSAYGYRTGASVTGKRANDVFISFIRSFVGKKRFRKLIDIGCSDLYVLNALKDTARERIGIDPVLKGQERKLSKGSLTVVGDLFEQADLTGLIGGEDALVLSSHTLEHIEDPSSLIERLYEATGKGSLFVFQFPYLSPLLADYRFDQIFHQHLGYFTKRSILYLIERFGGEIINFSVNYHHWGTLMIAFRKTSKRDSAREEWRSHPAVRQADVKRRYDQFRSRMAMTNAYLASIKKEDIYGFGATPMLPILGYHLRNDFSRFKAILDDDKKKRGLYYINLSVPIYLPEDVHGGFTNANILVTAYNTSRSVLPRVIHLDPKRIIVPSFIF